MSTKYRVDVAQDYERLMNQAIEHWDRVDKTRSDDAFTRDPARIPAQAPAHPRYDFEAARSYNLIAADYVNAEAFGRRRKQSRRTVIKTSGGGARAGQMPPSDRVGQAGLPPPTVAGQSSVPGWKGTRDPFDDPGLTYENAIYLVETRGRQAALALVQGMRLGDSSSTAPGGAAAADAAGASSTSAHVTFGPVEPANVLSGGTTAPRTAADVTSRGPGRPRSAADARFERADPDAETRVFVTGRGQDRYESTGSPELTNPDFTWVTGQSYWAELVEGIEVVGGGSVWEDVERTHTVRAAPFGRPG